MQIGFLEFFFSISMKILSQKNKSSSIRLQTSKITTDLEQYNTELKTAIVSKTSRNTHRNNEFYIPY